MSLALLLKYWKPLAIVALVVATLGFARAWITQRDAVHVAEGQAIERAHVADSVIAVLDSTRKHVDTLIVRDTVRLTRLFARTDTIRDTLMQHLHDTSYVLRYVATTDSTIHACTEVLHDCAAYRASTTLEIAQLRALTMPAPLILFRPTIRQRSEYVTLGAAVGALAAHLLWK